VALVTAVAWVRSLALELLCVAGAAKKKRPSYAVHNGYIPKIRTQRCWIKGFIYVSVMYVCMYMPITANQKRKAMALLTLDKIDFKAINIARDKKSSLIVVNDLLHQEDINILIHICLQWAEWLPSKRHFSIPMPRTCECCLICKTSPEVN